MNRSLLWILGIGAIAAAFGCMSHEEATAASDEVQEVSSRKQDLYATGAKWPNGRIPVCFMSGTAAQKQQVKDHLYGSWSAVANIEFTGFSDCATAPAGVVPIQLQERGGGHAKIGYKWPGATYEAVRIGTTETNFLNGGITVHELGHVLGFLHETQRPGFMDDTTRNANPGVCSDGDVPGGDTLFTANNDYLAIMNLTYCLTNHPAVLSRWDIVGAQNRYGRRADYVVQAGSTLFARSRSNGNIYKRSGTSWVQAGGPATQFVAVGSTLFALAVDSASVWQYSGTGTNWTMIGGIARSILRCGDTLCAEAENGDLYRFASRDGSWTIIGDRALMYASTATNLYRLTRDHVHVQVHGFGTAWADINFAPVGAIYATSSTLYATDLSTGNLSRNNGGTSWSPAGGPGRLFVGAGSTLYGWTPDLASINRYSGSGTSWSNVGNSADWVYGSQSGDLFATDVNTKDIYQYSGSGTGWTFIGQP